MSFLFLHELGCTSLDPDAFAGTRPRLSANSSPSPWQLSTPRCIMRCSSQIRATTAICLIRTSLDPYHTPGMRRRIGSCSHAGHSYDWTRLTPSICRNLVCRRTTELLILLQIRSQSMCMGGFFLCRVSSPGASSWSSMQTTIEPDAGTFISGYFPILSIPVKTCCRFSAAPMLVRLACCI